MRLLKLGSRGEVSLTKDFINDTPRYAILSHTWGVDEDGVSSTISKTDVEQARLVMPNFSFVVNKRRKMA